MQTRSSSREVTFRKEFSLFGVAGMLPPGTYTVHLEETLLDAVSFTGWRQTSATMALKVGGAIEHVHIDMQDLREALVQDGDQSTDPPASPPVAMNRRRVRDRIRRGLPR